MALTMIPATPNRPTSWTGLSSDAKPTGPEVKPRALIFYTDTPAIVEYDGVQWIQISSGGAGYVRLASTASEIFPQDVPYSQQLIGTPAAPVVIDGGGASQASGPMPVTQFSQTRSMLLIATGTAIDLDIDVTPSMDVAGTYAGDTIALATGLTATKLIDLPLSTLPYAPYYDVTITNNGAATPANDATVALLMLGRGGT